MASPSRATVTWSIDRGRKRDYDPGRDADRRVVYGMVLLEAAGAEEVARVVLEFL
jgi:hypothetical protein